MDRFEQFIKRAIERGATEAKIIPAGEIVVDARANKLHESVNDVEKLAQELHFTFAVVFIGGACKLCDPCVGVKSGKHCKYPFKARPSMEAVGIDVHLTSQKAGLGFSPDIGKEAVWDGLVLLE